MHRGRKTRVSSDTSICHAIACIVGNLLQFQDLPSGISTFPATVCFPLKCRYLALAFTVVGTLVDLVPEALLLTEIALHPKVFTSYDAMRTLLRLAFSDGKPIVVFASSDESEKLHPSLVPIRDSLRRRLTSVAASLSMRDGCAGDQKPRWTYAGLIGILVGGELLTGESLNHRIYRRGWSLNKCPAK